MTDLPNGTSRRDFHDVYARLQALHFPPLEQHVLLNFDTREYVIDRLYNTQLGVGLTYVRDPSIWGLGDVVLSKVLWFLGSVEPLTCGFGSQDNLCDRASVWAGHRFAIVTLSVFYDAISERGGWTDATDESYEHVKAMRSMLADYPR
jgi:hypothetical protein